jgi:hypothetical protein
MPRSRLVALFAGLVFTLLVLPSATLAATATTTTTPAIRLGCAVVIPVPRDIHPAIVCRWTAVAGDVKAYRVWRRVDMGPRQLIATVAPDKPLRHADWNIRPTHLYSYRVVAIGQDGTALGSSALVSVRLGRAPEVLRFDCAFLIDGATRGVACHWGPSTRAAAVRYVLFRSVDSGPRQAIYRVGLNGRRSFLDRDVKAGQTVRYAVVALAADGRIVGIGGPDAVKIPEVTFTAAAR